MPGGFRDHKQGDPTAYNVTYGHLLSPSLEQHSYQYLLPNLDATLSIRDDLDIRFNASRTLTRSPISPLNPTYQSGRDARGQRYR